MSSSRGLAAKPLPFTAEPSSRIADLEASRIREVANAGLGRKDVLAFWFGESDQPTPAFICEAAMAALRDGRTFYTQNMGIPELREAIAIAPSTMISITAMGVSQARILFCSAVAPVRNGDACAAAMAGSSSPGSSSAGSSSAGSSRSVGRGARRFQLGSLTYITLP